MATVSNEVWTLPHMPPDQWDKQPPVTWRRVEYALRDGWIGKLNDGYRLAHGRDRQWFEGWGKEAFVKADELGAPVGQLFTMYARKPE